MRLRLLSLFFLCTLLPLGAQVPPAPQPPRLVNDLAGIFTAEQVAQLEQDLVAFDDSTSNQIAVVTVSDLGGEDPNHFAYQILESWGVGGASHNNGLVLLIKPKVENQAGRVAISVGYGLEGRVTDAACKRIIETRIIPCFRENDYYGGAWEGAQALKALAVQEYAQARESEGEGRWGADLLSFLIIAFFIYLFVRALRRGKGGSGSSGSGGGGFGLPGGGYTGGWSGSRTSSSWGSSSRSGGFGGFGGGRGGGGGASGSW